MIFQQKLRGIFHIIFCSKPRPLQVTPSKVRGAAVGGNNARFGCNAPASERSLNRHRYHTLRKFFSIQRRLSAKVLHIHENVNVIFHRKFSKLYFLSEQFFCVRFSCRDIGKKTEKVYFFQDCGTSATDFDGDF